MNLSTTHPNEDGDGLSGRTFGSCDTDPHSNDSSSSDPMPAQKDCGFYGWIEEEVVDGEGRDEYQGAVEHVELTQGSGGHMVGMKDSNDCQLGRTETNISQTPAAMKAGIFPEVKWEVDAILFGNGYRHGPKILKIGKWYGCANNDGGVEPYFALDSFSFHIRNSVLRTRSFPVKDVATENSSCRTHPRWCVVPEVRVTRSGTEK